MDFLPTFARLAGGKRPEKKIAGHDILPLMAGDERAKSPYEVFYHWVDAPVHPAEGVNLKPTDWIGNPDSPVAAAAQKRQAE
jgi:hypothetical protein